MERDLELQEYFFNVRPVLDVSHIQNPYMTHKNISIDDPLFSDVLKVRREFAASFINNSNIVILSDQPLRAESPDKSQGLNPMISEQNANVNANVTPSENKKRVINNQLPDRLLGGLEVNSEESLPLKTIRSEHPVPAEELHPEIAEEFEQEAQANNPPPQFNLNLAGLFNPTAGTSLVNAESGQRPSTTRGAMAKEIKFSRMKKCLQTVKAILQKYSSSPETASELWVLEYKFAPILEIYCKKVIASRSSFPDPGDPTQSDFLDSLKLLMGLIISTKLFLTTLSFSDIAIVFGATPEAFIDQFIGVKDLDDFLPVFRLMVEETYKWILEKTDNFTYKTSAEKDYIFEQSIHLMTFFNRLVLYDREANPQKIEKELLYFELIFTLYHKTDCRKLLEKLLEDDPEDWQNKNYTPEFDRLMKDIQKVSPKQSCESARFKISKEIMLHERSFAFICVVINSMALTCRRYFITETSLYIKRLMPELIEDLLQFTGKGLIELETQDEEYFESVEFSDSEESQSELESERGSRNRNTFRSQQQSSDGSPTKNDQKACELDVHKEGLEPRQGLNLNAAFTAAEPENIGQRGEDDEFLEHQEIELGILGDGSQKLQSHDQNVTSKKLNSEERAQQQLQIYPGYTEAGVLAQKQKHDKKLDNKYYYTLFGSIVELQTNLLFRLEEGYLDNERLHDPAIIPPKAVRTMMTNNRKKLEINLAGLKVQDGFRWIPTKAKLLDLCQSNLLNICTKTFVEKLKSDSDNTPAIHILSKVCTQLFTFFRKMDLLRNDPQWRRLEIKPLCTVYYLLRELAEILGITKFNFVDPSEFYADSNYNITEILEALIVIQQAFDIKPELQQFRRSSISCDEQNLDILRRLIQHSNRYNFQPSQKERSYYTAIFAGQVEIEVDQREIYMGLARAYVKILNKMVLGEDFTKYKKLMKFGNQKLQEVGLGFINETDSEFHPVHRFFISINTSYFYNDMYGRAIVLYEKLIDELPDLRSYMYNEAVKNLSIVNTFSGRKIELIYPFVKNIMDLCLHLSTVVEHSIFHSDSWGTLISRCFSAQSLLNNMTLNSYSYFKKIFCYSVYLDPKRKDYYESDLSLPFSKLDEIAQFEQGSFSYMTSICMRMQRFVDNNHMRSSAKLYHALSNKYVVTKLIYMTQWLHFISATVYDDPRLHEYIYDKLFSRYLLKIVFTYEDNSNIEIVYLKKAILTTLFKLCQSNIVLEKMVKYHVELKHVYDVLIRTTKAHLVTFVDTYALNNPWWKCCSKNKQKDSQDNNEFIADFLQSLKSFTRKSTFRQYLYHPNSFEPEFPKLDMVDICSNIFSGCFYNKDISKLFEMKSPDAILEKLNIKKISEIYFKSSSRDLGFQIIHLMIKMITQIEHSTGKRLWSSKKETALAYFDRHIGKLAPSKLHELKIVYLLSLITRQIEVVGIGKKNKLITFRKYPEVYTLDDDEMLGSLSDTSISDIKREMSKVIARLYLECSVQYTIRNQNYFLYTTFTPKNLRQFPRFVWTIYLILNFVTMTGYVNEDDNGNFKYKSSEYKTAEMILVLLIVFFSILLSSIILFARLRALFIAKNVTRYGSVGQIIDPNSSVSNVNIFKKLLEHPSVKLFVNAVFERTTINMMMNCILAVLGYYINPVYYAAGLLLFVVFSTTMHTLRQAITKNIADILVTLFLMLMMVLIFTYGQFDYYVNNYTGPFGSDNNHQPCISMYTCYLSTLSYGMRQGGGIGEVTTPIVYPSSGYQSKTAFDVGFFFTINMISLNIIFGIIIDTFGQLRDEDAEREDAYRNYCMICGVPKTDFEAEGINFNMHVREQHLINDYMSFMIRLYINRNNLQHDLDYQIYHKFTKYNVSWFPNKDTLYVSSLDY